MNDDTPEPALPTEELQGGRSRRVKASNLLWFISSRPYVPMSDLRRRFSLDSEHGIVLHDEQGPLHVGLPRQAAEAILDLKRKNKIGIEYDTHIAMRVAIGVYPLRVRVAPSGPPPRVEVRPRPDAHPDLPEQPDEPAEEAIVAVPDDAAPPPPTQSGGRRRNRSRRRR